MSQQFIFTKLDSFQLTYLSNLILYSLFLSHLIAYLTAILAANCE